MKDYYITVSPNNPNMGEVYLVIRNKSSDDLDACVVLQPNHLQLLIALLKKAQTQIKLQRCKKPEKGWINTVAVGDVNTGKSKVKRLTQK